MLEKTVGEKGENACYLYCLDLFPMIESFLHLGTTRVIKTLDSLVMK